MVGRLADSMRIQRAVLWLSLVSFGGFGAAFTAFPRRMASFVDVALPTDTALVDFTATYGGLELGLAVFLWWCTRRDVRVPLGLVAAGCGLAGFAIVRLAGILLSSDIKPMLYGVLIAEIAGALVNFWAAGRPPEHR